jgi:hypothetical protein
LARTLDFDTYTDSDDLEPIEIKLGPKGKKKEVFHANPMIPGVELIDLVAGLSLNDPAENARAVRKIMDLAIVEDDRERFWEFVADPKNFVSMTKLDDIAMGLAEEYMGGVPTDSEPRSSSGSETNGSGRKGASSRKAATSAA